MVESADTADSKSAVGDNVWVQVPLSALSFYGHTSFRCVFLVLFLTFETSALTLIFFCKFSEIILQFNKMYSIIFIMNIYTFLRKVFYERI